MLGKTVQKMVKHAQVLSGAARKIEKRTWATHVQLLHDCLGEIRPTMHSDVSSATVMCIFLCAGWGCQLELTIGLI